jgi:hypothetical protein
MLGINRMLENIKNKGEIKEKNVEKNNIKKKCFLIL